jgi:hypothetical protein
MTTTAKLFRNGRSQAVRLPRASTGSKAIASASFVPAEVCSSNRCSPMSRRGSLSSIV